MDGGLQIRPILFDRLRQREGFATYSKKLRQADQSGVHTPHFANEWNDQLHKSLFASIIFFESVGPGEVGVRTAMGLRRRENSFSVIFGPSGIPHFATGTAGFP